MLIAKAFQVHCCYAICTLWCLVSPKVSVWAGTNGHLLPLQYTTYIMGNWIHICMYICTHTYVIGTQLKHYMVLQRKSNAHAHCRPWKESPTVLPHTCQKLKWWIAREHLRVVGCFNWTPTPSLPSPPDSMWEWRGSNTPVSLNVAIHGVDQCYQLRVLSVGVVV